MAAYTQISTKDEAERSITFSVEDESTDLAKDVVIRNDHPFPISRPPPKNRDQFYAVIFLLHFFGILLLSLIEQNSLQHSLISYGRAGSWASILMIVTLLGSFTGATVSFIVGIQDIREMFLNISMLFSVILKVILGNALLIGRSEFSIFGLFVLISASIDALRLKYARDNISFTSALVQMAIDITGRYGFTFVFICILMMFLQSCVLLWWGAFFIGLISTVPSGFAEPLIMIMILSLFWITQLFHSMVRFIIGGCVLWVFLKDEDTDLGASDRIFLYTRCAFTSSLGSLCKGAMLVPFYESILELGHWATDRTRNLNSEPKMCSIRGLVYNLVSPFLPAARRHHRLTFCLMAAFGRTFSKTAEDHMSAYPETLRIAVEDSSFFSLNCVAAESAGIIAVLFAFFAENRSEERLWPLFLFICFYLCYCGSALAVHVYSATIDALVVASALSPVRFGKENQIIFLRFLRNSEEGLR